MTREALLVTHTGRVDSTEHARTVARDLVKAGFTVRVVDVEAGELAIGGLRPVSGPNAAEGVEIVCALGGDGTLLRAAELARPAKAPLLGINLGKVGFLAEAEISDIDEAVRAVHCGWLYHALPRSWISFRTERTGPRAFRSRRSWPRPAAER